MSNDALSGRILGLEAENLGEEIIEKIRNEPFVTEKDEVRKSVNVTRTVKYIRHVDERKIVRIYISIRKITVTRKSKELFEVNHFLNGCRPL